MRQFRYSIASLITVVGFVAVAAAGLRAATPEWNAGLFATVLLLLLVGVLLAIHRPGRKRAFWLGFAIFGWVALGASLLPTIEERLPTTSWLTRLASLNPATSLPRFSVVDLDRDGRLDVYVRRLDSLPESVGSPQDVAEALSLAVPARTSLSGSLRSPVRPFPNPASTENFVAIGHSLVAILLAFVGGLFSRFLFDQNRPESRTLTPHSPVEVLT